MACFITGATGFIGRYLVRELLAREDMDEIFVLVRAGSSAKLAALRKWWGPQAERVIPIEGDLGASALCVNASDAARLRGQVRHCFHLAAIYVLNASAASLEAANIAGTEHALEFASEVRAGCFHLCSSIAAAGRYPGVFTEDMFEQASGLAHPYFRTKHESEALVRRQSHTPWRVYRPGMVVGDSRTGHITKVDGPYYFFKPLQQLRKALPPWFPIIGFEGGYVNLVPVDYVARALVHLAHAPGQDGRCFHLTDPRPRRVGEMLNIFANAAHAPPITLRLDASILDLAPAELVNALKDYAPLRALIDGMLEEWRMPRAVLSFLNMPTLYDNVRAHALLEPAGVALPPLESYAWRLWDYWERHLDPDLSIERTLADAVRDKRVMITGGAAGIGYATALRLCDAGAHMLIVDRAPERLAATRAAVEQRGGRVDVYECDLTDEAACTHLISEVNGRHGGVDVLINNAGHSIRRSIEISYERFHDYQRLMALNYFAAVRLTLAFLPGMAARRSGHVIAVSSLGVLTSQPRFSAYIASKAALEAFTRSASAEYHDRGVRFTIVNFPLVRTAMVAPTRAYAEMHMMSPEEAAQRIVCALVHQPARVTTPLGRLAQALETFAPALVDLINNAAFHMYPDSAAARGVDEPETPTKEAQDLARLLRHVHWG
jgi:NAD(P)-dependent dehydrogenase (short-subunit alcohol dehydrogenase family)